MNQIRRIQTGYILGIMSLLAAIIYFFASNWGGLERWHKFSVSFLLVIVLYVLSLSLSRLPHRGFLGKLFLLGGTVAFGVSVALIGQTYNSHADSYALFLTWSVPVFLFTLIIRYQPLYILSYVLIHLTILLYFFPTMNSWNREEQFMLDVALLIALINILLFVTIETRMFRSSWLRLMSFTVTHVTFITLSNSYVFDDFSMMFNIVACVLLVGSFFYFHNGESAKGDLLLTGLLFSIFAVFKFVELSSYHFSSLFFLWGIIFVMALLTGNYYFLRYIQRMNVKKAVTEPKQSTEIFQHVISAIIPIIGVIVGTGSILGFMVLTMNGQFEQYQLSFFMVGSILLFIMIVMKQANTTIRSTIAGIGIAIDLVAIIIDWQSSIVLNCVLLILLGAAWIKLNTRGIKLWIYITFTVTLWQMINFFIASNDNSYTWTFLLLAVINIAIYVLQPKLARFDTQDALKYYSFLTAIISGFILTFLGDSDALYYMFNALYILIVTALVLHYVKREMSWYARISMTFWSLYLLYKYYDFAWKLLDKSVTFALIGLFFIGAAYLYEKKKRIYDEDETTVPLTKHQTYMIAIIVLQLAMVSVQIVNNEWILSRGKQVKLALQPLDPRSMLQGDYLELRYRINFPDQLESSSGSFKTNPKVKVILAPDSTGSHLYSYKAIYQDGMKLKPGEVIINGKYNGYDSIYYGIENYFIEEGTGRDWEQRTNFAMVRIGSTGNALLEDVLEK